MSGPAIGRAFNERAMLNFYNRIVAAFDCPTFRVHRNGTEQAGVPSSMRTKVMFDSVRMWEPDVQGWDSHQAFDTLAARYRPKIPGYYAIGASLAFLSGAAATLELFKNDGDSPIAEASGSGTINLSTLIYLNGSTDYAEFHVMQTSGSVQTISGDAGVTAAWGYRVPG